MLNSCPLCCSTLEAVVFYSSPGAPRGKWWNRCKPFISIHTDCCRTPIKIRRLGFMYGRMAREGSSYGWGAIGTRKASADTRDFYHQLLLDWRAVTTGIYKVQCSCCLLSRIQRNQLYSGMLEINSISCWLSITFFSCKNKAFFVLKYSYMFARWMFNVYRYEYWDVLS